MNNIVRTAIFDEWLLQLKDLKGKAHIIKRIRSAERGNFGDSAALGSRVSEMRIHAGPGYRIYFMRVEAAVYVLLCAGTKRRQQADILKAKRLARLLKED
jgi:putative addiction module killer protein